MVVTPPERRTPRQYSRSRSAAVTVSRGLIRFISHLPRRVPPPSRACRDLLSLHEKGVGGQHGAVPHHHAVIDRRADSERAAGTDRASIGFECAILQRVTLDLAPLIEDAVVPDGGESPLRYL